MLVSFKTKAMGWYRHVESQPRNEPVAAGTIQDTRSNMFIHDIGWLLLINNN